MERKSVGVLINVLGSLAINLGNNLQSSGHRGHRSLEDENVGKVNPKYAKMNGVKSSQQQSHGKYKFTSHREDSGGGEIDEVEVEEENGYWIGEEENEKNEFLWALLDCSGGESSEVVSSIKRKERDNKSNAVVMKNVSTTSSSMIPSWLICSKWLVGTCFFFSGTIAVFISYSFAPQSLIAPLGSVQFVSNIFFAKWIHKSPITRRMLVATSVILIGIALVVHYSPDPNPDFIVIGGESIRDLYFYYNYQVSKAILTNIFLYTYKTHSCDPSYCCHT